MNTFINKNEKRRKTKGRKKINRKEKSKKEGNKYEKKSQLLILKVCNNRGKKNLQVLPL